MKEAILRSERIIPGSSHSAYQTQGGEETKEWEADLGEAVTKRGNSDAEMTEGETFY